MEKTYEVIDDNKVKITTYIPQEAVYDIAEFQQQKDTVDAKILDLQAQSDELKATIDAISPKINKLKVNV